jgi:hypothetical protein
MVRPSREATLIASSYPLFSYLKKKKKKKKEGQV